MKKDCSARFAVHANGCSHHHRLSEDSTGTRLLITLALNFIIPVIQIIGGIMAHSMALNYPNYNTNFIVWGITEKSATCPRHVFVGSLL
jgi:hypothetical protein